MHDHQYNVYWYLTMPLQAHSQHQPLPHKQHLPHHLPYCPAMLMSPWNLLANLQPSTLTLLHTLPTPAHASTLPPSSLLSPGSSHSFIRNSRWCCIRFEESKNLANAEHLFNHFWTSWKLARKSWDTQQETGKYLHRI